MERIIKSRAEATRDQATLRAQQSPWNVGGRANDGQGGLQGPDRGTWALWAGADEVVAEAGVALLSNEKQLWPGMWTNWFGI